MTLEQAKLVRHQFKTSGKTISDPKPVASRCGAAMEVFATEYDRLHNDYIDLANRYSLLRENCG